MVRFADNMKHGMEWIAGIGSNQRFVIQDSRKHGIPGNAKSNDYSLFIAFPLS